jgi:hypothetical protein
VAGGGSATGGTGGSSGGAATFACDYNMQAGAHFCWTWNAANVPSPAPVIAAWQMACTQGMGTTVTSCPTSGAVGKCTFTSNSGGYSVSQTIYYYAPVRPHDRHAAVHGQQRQRRHRHLDAAVGAGAPTGARLGGVRLAAPLILLFPLLACAHGQPSGLAAPTRLSEDIAANAPWRRSMRIIDVHGHISPASVEQALAAMDAHFIDRTVNLTAGSTVEKFTAAKQAFDQKGAVGSSCTSTTSTRTSPSKIPSSGAR